MTADGEGGDEAGQRAGQKGAARRRSAEQPRGACAARATVSVWPDGGGGSGGASRTDCARTSPWTDNGALSSARRWLGDGGTPLNSRERI